MRTVDGDTWVTASDGGLTGLRLFAALDRAAKGLLQQEAAVRLLGEHDVWLLRPGFAEYVLMLDDDQPDTAFEQPMYAKVDWAGALAAAESGVVLGGSGSAVRMLRLAASLAGGPPVDLSEALSGLDQRNGRLVQAAVVHSLFGAEQARPLWEGNA